MSFVTDVVIHCETDNLKLEAALLGELPEVARGQRFTKLDTSNIGGHKSFSSAIYVAAFNYFSDFEPWLRTLPLGNHDVLTLSAYTEGEYIAHYIFHLGELVVFGSSP